MKFGNTIFSDMLSLAHSLVLAPFACSLSRALCFTWRATRDKTKTSSYAAKESVGLFSGATWLLRPGR